MECIHALLLPGRVDQGRSVCATYELMLKLDMVAEPRAGMDIAAILDLSWMVLDHLIMTTAYCSENIPSPTHKCLVLLKKTQSEAKTNE